MVWRIATEQVLDGVRCTDSENINQQVVACELTELPTDAGIMHSQVVPAQVNKPLYVTLLPDPVL